MPEDAILFLKVFSSEIAQPILAGMCNLIKDHMDQDPPKPAVDPDDEAVTRCLKRKREELELLKAEEEINAMRVKSYREEEEARLMTQTRILNAATALELFRDPARNNLDSRTRLMMQDSLQNSIMNAQFTFGSKKAITDGSSNNKPISIGSVAARLGYKPTTNDAKRIGMDVRKRYIKLHDKPPSKHDQLCDGRVTLVNSYTEQDRPLVEEALHAYFKPSDTSDDGEA
jgi:hypothetical protein